MFSARLPIPGFELRLVEDRHVPAVFETVRRNLPHLQPWMPWATDDYSLDTCRAWQRKTLEQFSRNDGVDAGIFAGDLYVGTIGQHGIDWVNRRTTIGYWLDADHQGRGLMTAACRTLLSYLFDTLKLHRVELRCNTENLRSRRVAERLGFVAEGTLRQVERHPDGQYRDHVVYAMLAPDWRD